MLPEAKLNLRGGLRLTYAAALLAVFVVGAGAGGLASRGHLLSWLREAFAAPAPQPAHEAQQIDGAGPRRHNTHLHAIDLQRLPLTGVSGTGGGIEEIGDGRLFYATGHGAFGLIDLDGAQHVAPFRIEMNEEALKKNPVFNAPTFNFHWFRVTDILATPLGGGRYRLLVGHHIYDETQRCVSLNLSRAEITVKDDAVSLSAPFRIIFTAAPCITFFGPEWDNAFWGHLSGGRLIGAPDGRVLFSTGDHGYSGVSGYPAVAADKGSTLGKILTVDPETGASSIYASGLRNPQGLFLDRSGRLWETEHGPRGGDELNLIREGGDYGWPFDTLGTDYGPKPWPLGEHKGRHDGHEGRRGGALPPVFAFVPSIGVSNLIEYRGAAFPLWRGDLLVESLMDSSLYRVRLDGERVEYVERINLGGRDETRLRDIVELRDGRLALWTDASALIVLSNPDAARGAKPYLDAAIVQRATADMSPAERAVAIAAGENYGPGTPAMRSPAAARGMQIHRDRCLSCHAVNGSGSVGPTHRGLVGRPVGAQQARDAGVADGAAGAERAQVAPSVWSGASAAAFAVHPEKALPSSAMAPVALTPEEQRDLAAYLETLK
ncbi:MAG: PQQ-dependent sugar dehydrogenase [Parvularculaceae bacterium]